jgi:hypothetical protein
MPKTLEAASGAACKTSLHFFASRFCCERMLCGPKLCCLDYASIDANGLSLAGENTRQRFGHRYPGMPKSAAAPNFVVDSSQGFDHTRAQIRDILRNLATMRRR